MGKRLRVADPLPWLLLIGSLFASLWVFPLGLFQSQTFSSARASSYNDWVCGQSSMQPRWGAASASCEGGADAKLHFAEVCAMYILVECSTFYSAMQVWLCI